VTRDRKAGIKQTVASFTTLPGGNRRMPYAVKNKVGKQFHIEIKECGS
jgi:hypothetical protein